jgi:hypothetical protein
MRVLLALTLTELTEPAADCVRGLWWRTQTSTCAGSDKDAGEVTHQASRGTIS